ncbi:STAS domain-containing protein [Streptomyces sp. 62]|uniref:STAS domain-containing protein n=1 Tax=Streptomyces sp. NPDC012756 TaxID=3364847 RepID=UPI000E249121
MERAAQGRGQTAHRRCVMATGATHSGPPTARTDRGRSVVRVSGEMDYEHAEELHASLATALDGAPAGSDIVVDLQNSSFCDSSGLNVLLSVRLEALKRGVHLVLAAPSHQMIRLLEFTGSDDLFTYVPVVTD